MKTQKRSNNRGFSHHFLLPVIVVLLVAGIGGYVMFRNSNAATKTYTYTVPVCKKKGTLRTGSKGSCVRVLQKSLNNWYGKKQLVVDGSFGGNTRKAVRAFQTAKKIKVDGVVGTQTWGKLAAYPATVKLTVRTASGSSGSTKPANPKKVIVPSCKYSSKSDSFKCTKKYVVKDSKEYKAAVKTEKGNKETALLGCAHWRYRNNKSKVTKFDDDYSNRSCIMEFDAAEIRASNP